MKNEQIKAIVKEKYSELAVARTESCCNSGGDDPMSIMSDKYDQLQATAEPKISIRMIALQ
ncbi:MAG: hypothetical protein AAFP02_02580, partial [Bacteroidota bacterium]